jgi:acyl carrier protein
MNEAEIFAKLTDVVRTIFDEYEGPVGPSLSAKDVAQWDSLANVQFMVLVERAFRIRFTTTEISSLRNLGELAQTIARKAA